MIKEIYYLNIFKMGRYHIQLLLSLVKTTTKVCIKTLVGFYIFGIFRIKGGWSF